MTDVTHAEPLPRDAVATVEAMQAIKARRRSLDVDELVLAAHFADLNAVPRHEQAHVLPGQERVLGFGGAGTPQVAEFCTVELAAALGLRDAAVHSLIADALDLRHRLPALWRLVLDGQVPVWQARHVAVATRELDLDVAGLVDLQVARSIRGMAWKRVVTMVDGLVLAHLPVEQAEQRRQEALDARGVWVDQSPNGVADVSAVLDAPDGLRLDAMVGRLAGVLAAGGVGGGKDARRARALGLLATPARALQLLQASLLDELPGSPAVQRPVDEPQDHHSAAEPVESTSSTAPAGLLDGPCRLVGEPGHVCGTVVVDPELLSPQAELVIHLTDTTLAEGSGPARAPKLQPLLSEWLDQLLPDHRISVRPVIDANHQAPSDAYECPPTMREAVQTRNPYEVFPWSTRAANGLDLDHTLPWQPPGTDRPPGGPTHPDNLGPLTRKVHRAKTHAGWRLTQPLPGHFLWQSPLGYRYLVTPSRTIDLGRSDVPAHLMDGQDGTRDAA